MAVGSRGTEGFTLCGGVRHWYVVLVCVRAEVVFLGNDGGLVGS